MSAKTLLSDTLCSELSRLSAHHQRMEAAISYVTASYLDFGVNDVLVCDASDRAIKTGMTSARTLRRFFRKGAKLYSYAGLHSKVAIIDAMAVIGSANLSENAGLNTCEASLLTDDRQIAGLIQAFIEQVRRQAIPITARLLARLEALPVDRRAPPRRLRRNGISGGKSRVWIASTIELPEEVSKAEAAFETAGKRRARQLLSDAKNEPYMLRWFGRSLFRAEAKPGDLVIEVSRIGGKRSTRYSVLEPRVICYRQDGMTWTRFYLEGSRNPAEYSWRDVKNDFAKLGHRNISARTTRELTGSAANIVSLLE